MISLWQCNVFIPTLITDIRWRKKGCRLGHPLDCLWRIM